MHMSVSHVSGILALLTAGVMALAQGASSEKPSATVQPSASGNVKYFSKDDVSASFAKGGTLATENNYRVMTAHRTESGNVEIHRSYTDVFYIVQGSTNLVTGGRVIGEKATNPDEPRGDSIEGGETRRLSAGDVAVIPAGIPHWMKDVEGTLLYFVVKVKNP
ncbi:MAG: hypothetical protein DMG62_14025 [Acidobacteria bacterium]|nr:MAG: hypothetical protein DMG62_14025 [Acidobacteriota bacterium]